MIFTTKFNIGDELKLKHPRIIAQDIPDHMIRSILIETITHDGCQTRYIGCGSDVQGRLSEFNGAENIICHFNKETPNVIHEHEAFFEIGKQVRSIYTSEGYKLPMYVTEYYVCYTGTVAYGVRWMNTNGEMEGDLFQGYELKAVSND